MVTMVTAQLMQVFHLLHVDLGEALGLQLFVELQTLQPLVLQLS